MCNGVNGYRPDKAFMRNRTQRGFKKSTLLGGLLGQNRWVVAVFDVDTRHQEPAKQRVNDF